MCVLQKRFIALIMCTVTFIHLDVCSQWIWTVQLIQIPSLSLVVVVVVVDLISLCLGSVRS